MPNPSRNPRAPSAYPFHSIPLLDLHRQYVDIREEVLDAIARVCDSQHFILGSEVEAFERELAAFCGVADAVACSSGTDALWLALTAAGVQPGDVVITSAFSFFASASAIVRAGARPVLVDIDAQTFNLDHAALEAKLSAGADKVRALLPVHLYGQCSDMDSLFQLASKFNLTVIEDAAQAIGAEWRGRRAGGLGITAAFSFYPTKNLSAYGDAGAVTTPDSAIAERLRRLRNHGSPQRYLHTEFGWNARMDAIQAAVLRVKLPHLENWNAKRRERAATYDRLFRETGLALSAKSPGSSTGGVTENSGERFPIVLPHAAAGAHHVFHQYVVRAQRRDLLRKFLSERNIGTEIYYPIPLHLQPCLAYLGYMEGDLPESEKAAREVLALPMFAELTEGEQAWVVESIADFYS